MYSLLCSRLKECSKFIILILVKMLFIACSKLIQLTYTKRQKLTAGPKIMSRCVLVNISQVPLHPTPIAFANSIV